MFAMRQLNRAYRHRPCLQAGLAAITLTILITAGRLFADERPTSPSARKTYQKSLSHQKLEGKSLPGADLRKTEMTITHFQRADLRGADFTDSAMDRAELADADLSNARGLGTVDFGLGIDAQRANFQHADLHNARIPGTYFEGADFRGANLRGAFLSGRFHGAKFDDADVHDAVLLGAGGIESLHDDLRKRGAIVNAEDFVRLVRGGRDFTGCNLHGFQLANAELDAAPFENANLHSANLQGASLRRARISGANICWAKVGGAKLSEADLSAAHLIGADLTGADLSNAKCRGATFAGARLGRIKFIGTDLTNADLRGADLTGADLSGAILDGVQWDAAIIENLGGMSPAEQADLKSKAARWKYDLAQGFNQFVRAFAWPGWMITWAAGAVVLFRGCRRTSGHLSLKLVTGLHAVAALPAFAFLFLFVAGASPTVQLSGSLGGWSAWVQIWPLAFGLTLLALAGFIPIAIVAWVAWFRRDARGSIKHLAAATLLTGLSLLASLGTLTLLAPSA